MELTGTTLIGVSIIVIALIVLGVGLYLFLAGGSQSSGPLMGQSSGDTRGMKFNKDASAEMDFSRLKKEQLKSRKNKINVSKDQKFFMAGIFSAQDQAEFNRMQVIIPVLTGPAVAYILYSFIPEIEYLLIGLMVGVGVGFQAPNSILDRRVLARSEEILYYLPLVIEQLAIGVSSSLDIGPCIQRVVAMADERGSHNAVSELLKIAQNHIRSGASLEDALIEVGVMSGHTELKHCFMSLSQVAKHGGEITRQLQELADAVSSQRETQIEGKIKKLELAATGPVALVFAGFLMILLINFGLQIMKAF